MKKLVAPSDLSNGKPMVLENEGMLRFSQAMKLAYRAAQVNEFRAIESAKQVRIK